MYITLAKHVSFALLRAGLFERRTRGLKRKTRLRRVAAQISTIDEYVA